MKLLLLALAISYCCAQTTSPGFASYVKADKLFVAKRFPECLAALDESLTADPKLVPALTLKAKLAMTINRFDVARQSLDQALQVAPNSANIHFLYGLAAYLTNDLRAAQSRFETARKLNPADPRAAYYLGLTRESQGQPVEALKLYEQAARLEKPPTIETLLAPARLLLLQGRFDETTQWINRALKAHPTSRDAHFEHARLLMKKGDPAAATQAAESAIQLSGETTDAQIHYLLIRAYQSNGQPQKAQAHTDALKQ